MPLQPAAPTAGSDWQQRRLQDQARTDLRTIRMVLAFYLLDALLLAAYCAAGAGAWASPIAFVTCGLIVAAGNLLAGPHTVSLPLDDPRRTLVQVSAAIALVLGIAWTDPPLAVPMLLTVVSVISTAALRLAPRWLLAVSLVTAAAATAVAVAHQGRLTLPVAGPAQQLVTTLFVLWTLAKAASIHMAGMAMRLQLDASHARLAEALERVRQLAEIDELTGVANRRRVLAALEEERARYLRHGVGYAVAMLDVDHFKHINDRHGHLVGDAVLKAVADALRAALRNTDTVGRFGGEEFLLVLPGADTPEAALQTAERLRRAIEQQPWGPVAAQLQVTASIGVAHSAPGEPVTRLIERADRGLYRAKEGGRNQVAAWPALAEPVLPRPGAAPE